MTDPLRIGLVGAGQWARNFHAPMIAESPDAVLAGVWSPRLDRASAVATDHGAAAVEDVDELMAASDAIAFAVPPAVQAEMAPTAIARGLPMILEKPLAADLASARALAREIEVRGLTTAVTLTKRYHARTRRFIAAAERLRTEGVIALTGRYVHGGMLDSGFLDERERTGWRAEMGVIADLGPHLLDIAEAAAGEVIAIRAMGDPTEAVRIETEHSSGAGGQILLSSRVGVPASLTDVTLYGHRGTIAYDTGGLGLEEVRRRLIAEFTTAVRSGGRVAIDADHAVGVQRLVEAAAIALRTGSEVAPTAL
jgi:predicted dehydrogenase